MTNLSYIEAAELLQQIGPKDGSSGLIKKLKPTPVFFYPYLRRVIDERWKELNPQYPQEIKIPKANKYLLKGDFEPEYVIRLEEPVRMKDGTPMWFDNSADQIYPRFGYKNCDARYLSDVKFDMEFIHAFLGGSSGHGKSVTLNAMLASIFYCYAPWEVSVALSDAKIIEFKKYGVNHLIPHIFAIAATEDASFVISVLDKAYTEMNERAKIFGSLGVSNLKSFRKKTGLAYPRVLIVMDEVESTFKLAGKQAAKIADYIDGFARLGRAAGYHLCLATQNLSADIPKSATGQIRIRLCLGANQTTSEAVLGNTGATDNFGRIGRLISNVDVLNGGNTFPSNIKYQTPFLTDDDFEGEMEELETLGRQVGFQPTLAFYDEEDMKTIAVYKDIMDKALARMAKAGEITPTSSPVLLGYPAFVTPDPDGLLKLVFDHKDVENVAICSTQTERVAAHLHNFAYSLKNNWNILHYSSDTEMFEYTPTALDKQEARDATARPLQGLDALVRKRLFLAYVDGLVREEGSVQYNPAKVEEIFAKDKIPKEVWGNSLMCRRAVGFYAVQKDPTHASMWTPVKGMFNNFKDYYDECVKYNAIIEPITVAKFSKVVYFIGDLSKIIGYGRDNNGKAITALKKVMQDCNRAAVVFIIYSRSMENLNDLLSGLRYVIFDTPDGKDWGRMRTEAPVSQSGKLAILYDSLNTQNPQRKFKRTLLREEF